MPVEIKVLVTVFDGYVNPFFEENGFARNPWIHLAEEFSEKFGFRLETVFMSPPEDHHGDPTGVSAHLRNLVRRAGFSRRRIADLRRRVAETINPGGTRTDFDYSKGMRLLFAGSVHF